MAAASRQSLTNIRSPLTRFIGRGRELDELQRLLAEARLLTLIGPGGCGKTRLALQAADAVLPRFADGVWLAELAPLSDGGLVPQAVASALGIHEQPGTPLAQTLANQLEQRRGLLVFDNCEHLAAACAELCETLLRGCPYLHILATSRETLNLAGETVYVVPPLSLPEPQPWRGPTSARSALGAYEQSEAVQLFVERARAAWPAFALTMENGPWVADICRRLDGMPLAIELAAARVRVLSVQQIAKRLADSFQLLTSDSRTAPSRQRSLAATLDWSYALLPAGEQQLLQRLSVFCGGWSLEAAEAVGGGVAGEVLNLLSHLVDKSLVLAAAGAGGQARYGMLETIRQYAGARLAQTGAEAEARQRHLDYFLRWAEQAEPQLQGPRQFEGLQGFEAEHDNLRSALDWALTRPHLAGQGLRLASLTGKFWRLHGYHGEGRRRLAAALAAELGGQGGLRPEIAADRLRALRWAGWLAFFQSDYAAARATAEASLALSLEIGAPAERAQADALEMLGEVDAEVGQYDAAHAHYDQALAIYQRVGGPALGLGNTLTMLGWLGMRTGRLDEAERWLETAVPVCRAVGDPALITQALAGRGELAVRQGQYAAAGAYLEESLAARRQMGEDWGIAISLGSLGWVALRQGDFKRMRALLDESLSIRLRTGDVGGSAWCLERLAEAALIQGQAAPAAGQRDSFLQAARVYAAAAGLRARSGAVMDAADQPEHEAHLAALRAEMSKAEFATAWAQGGALTLEQAAEAALAEAAALPPETLLADVAAALAGAGGPAKPPSWLVEPLTRREQEVLELLAAGLTNPEIAEQLVLGVGTVKTYTLNIYRKLDVGNRTQAIARARDLRLLPH